jgi:hypothetical protein
VRLPSAISIISAIIVNTASVHPGEPGHTHPSEEWPFPDLEWALIGIGTVAIALAVSVLRVTLCKMLVKS